VNVILNRIHRFNSQQHEFWVMIKDIKACALRKPDLMDTVRGREILEFYHDELLPRVATTDLWHPDVRLQVTISDAVNPLNDEPCITPSTEALALTYLKNGCKKWTKMAKEKANGGRLSRAEGEADCPFTSSRGGRQQWGGWNLQGRQFFGRMLTAITQARQQLHVPEMEGGILERIQTKHAKKVSKLGKRKRELMEEENDDGRDEFGY
jgi:hypothetical protein